MAETELAAFLRESKADLNSTVGFLMPPERFVDAAEAAQFLRLRRRRLLELARLHELPGHPIGRGKRRIWRFRLSELAEALCKNAPAGCGFNPGKMQPGGSSAVLKREEQ